MAQLYGKKTSDGLPKALECTDSGLLKVDVAAVLAKLSADPATQTTLAAIAALLGTTGTVIAKKLHGAVTAVHSAITGTATSNAVDCSGYNSLLIHWVSDKTDKTWTLQILGAVAIDGTYVPWITSAGADNTYTTDISGFFIVQGIPQFIKVVATETDDGATVTCTVQPFNV